MFEIKARMRVEGAVLVAGQCEEKGMGDFGCGGLYWLLMDGDNND